MSNRYNSWRNWKNPILAKYWSNKAGVADYKDAAIFKELHWGDKPEGFVEWLAARWKILSKVTLQWSS